MPKNSFTSVIGIWGFLLTPVASADIIGSAIQASVANTIANQQRAQVAAAAKNNAAKEANASTNSGTSPGAKPAGVANSGTGPKATAYASSVNAYALKGGTYDCNYKKIWKTCFMHIHGCYPDKKSYSYYNSSQKPVLASCLDSSTECLGVNLQKQIDYCRDMLENATGKKTQWVKKTLETEIKKLSDQMIRIGFSPKNTSNTIASTNSQSGTVGPQGTTGSSMNQNSLANAPVVKRFVKLNSATKGNGSNNGSGAASNNSSSGATNSQVSFVTLGNSDAPSPSNPNNPNKGGSMAPSLESTNKTNNSTEPLQTPVLAQAPIGIEQLIVTSQKSANEPNKTTDFESHPKPAAETASSNNNQSLESKNNTNETKTTEGQAGLLNQNAHINAIACREVGEKAITILENQKLNREAAKKGVEALAKISDYVKTVKLKATNDDSLWAEPNGADQTAFAAAIKYAGIAAAFPQTNGELAAIMPQLIAQFNVALTKTESAIKVESEKLHGEEVHGHIDAMVEFLNNAKLSSRNAGQMGSSTVQSNDPSCNENIVKMQNIGQQMAEMTKAEISALQKISDAALNPFSASIEEQQKFIDNQIARLETLEGSSSIPKVAQTSNGGFSNPDQAPAIVPANPAPSKPSNTPEWSANSSGSSREPLFGRISGALVRNRSSLGFVLPMWAEDKGMPSPNPFPNFEVRGNLIK